MSEITPEIIAIIEKYASISKKSAKRTQANLEWLAKYKIVWLVALIGIPIVLFMIPLGLLFLWYANRQDLKYQAAVFGRLKGQKQEKKFDHPFLQFPWIVFVETKLIQIWQEEGLWAVSNAERTFLKLMEERLKSMSSLAGTLAAVAPEQISDQLAAELAGIPAGCFDEQSSFSTMIDSTGNTELIDHNHPSPKTMKQMLVVARNRVGSVGLCKMLYLSDQSPYVPSTLKSIIERRVADEINAEEAQKEIDGLLEKLQ